MLLFLRIRKTSRFQMATDGSDRGDEAKDPAHARQRLHRRSLQMHVQELRIEPRC